MATKKTTNKRKQQKAAAAGAAADDQSQEQIQHAPNVAFVHENPERALPQVNDGMELIKLPPVEEQVAAGLSGFYHEKADLIIRKDPESYKKIVKKG